MTFEQSATFSKSRKDPVSKLKRRVNDLENRVGNKNKRGPEATYYDTLKGRDVVIEMRNPALDDLQAKLLFVDTYSLIIELNGQRETLLYKHSISSIRLAD
jgi:hypothetical protein